MNPLLPGPPSGPCARFCHDAWRIVQLHLQAIGLERALAAGRCSEPEYEEWLVEALCEQERIRACHWSRDLWIELLRGIEGLPLRAWLAGLAVLVLCVL